MPPITLSTTIPEMLKDRPHLRGILDHYGLKGCGGELGPAENMEFFAKTHGVDAPQLLRELNAAAADPKLAPPVDFTPSLADSIYRRFFVGGIAMTFTAGAVWGALLLWQIAFAGSFTALPINEINAHGHSQIYGWVGLFIMGYAYQALPRFKHATLWNPWLAAMSFIFMLTGISLRVVGEFFAVGQDGQAMVFHPIWFSAGLLGSALEMIAGAAFACVIIKTYRVAGKPLETYDRWVFAAMGWMLLSVLADGFLYIMTSTASGTSELVWRVATFQSPLRDLQIYGLAMMMIFGVSLRFMPPVFGFHDPGEKIYRRLFWPLNLGIAATAILFALMLGTREFTVFAAPYYIASLVIVVCGLLISQSFRPFGKVTGTDRSVKFIRASHIWLTVSLLMLAFEPWYNRLTGQPFSHAFHGSMRHAITVGFISMSILGVGSKVVPNLNGVDTAKLSKLWVVFVLINLGCFLRVSNQLLTDFAPGSYPMLGISGTLEVTALALWAAHLISIMYRRRRATSAMTLETIAIEPQARVGLVLQRWPQTLDVFVKHGFGLLKNPVFRNTLARNVTLQQACEFQKADLLKLMDDLHTATRGRAGVTLAAPTCATAVNPALSVAEAARRYPATVPVFSELQLDACCGGVESIANAAQHHGLNLSNVLQRLSEAISKAKP